MSDSNRSENPNGRPAAEFEAELTALESRLYAVEDAVRALRAQFTRAVALSPRSPSPPSAAASQERAVGDSIPPGAAPPGTEEEARRYARILVSEIELYYPEEVAKGAAEKNLYARLKDPIDRSRRAYEQRYGKPAAGGSNYFEEEMVRRLAKGDPALIGPENA